MKILEQINDDLNAIAVTYARGNAHGWPITSDGNLSIDNLEYLQFKQKICITDPRLPEALRQIANILERYF